MGGGDEGGAFGFGDNLIARCAVPQPVGSSLQRDDRNPEPGEVLLMHHVAVHCHQHVKPLFGLSQQSPVFEASPTDERHGLDRVTGQIPPQSPIQVLVQEDVHSRRLKEFLSRGLQHGNDLNSSDTGKALQKIVDRLGGFQVVKQAFHWHPRADEYRRSP